MKPNKKVGEIMINKIKKTLRKIADPGSHGEKRSNAWPRVRKEHLQEHPACEACGGTIKCEVHHVSPFHEHPEKELDTNNLITLCENNKWLNCHLCIEHIGSFKKANPNVQKDAVHMKEMLKR